MDPEFLLKGLAIGFSIAAPVGPIGLLCIQRTLSGGRSSGLASGLGAATADAFYGSVAGFGLAFVSTFLISEQALLRLVGGAFLILLGARTVLRKGGVSSGEGQRPHGYYGDYASTLALTLTNPLTIISFAAVFAGLGLGNHGGDYPDAVALVVGVFAGSAAWWLILSTAVGTMGHRFTPGTMRLLNVLAGAVIALFGIAAILSVAF